MLHTPLDGLYHSYGQAYGRWQRFGMSKRNCERKRQHGQKRLPRNHSTIPIELSMHQRYLPRSCRYNGSGMRSCLAVLYIEVAYCRHHPQRHTASITISTPVIASRRATSWLPTSIMSRGVADFACEAALVKHIKLSTRPALASMKRPTQHGNKPDFAAYR